MKVFYLGSNIHREALDIIERASDAVLVYENIDITPVGGMVARLSTQGRAVCISKIAIPSAQAAPIPGGDEREQIVSTVLDDFRLFLLKTRFTRLDIDGAFSSLCYFSDVIDYALAFAEKYQPKLVYCSYTPHTVEAWIFMRTLEEAGVRVIRLITSPLPWVNLPIAGLSDEKMESLSSGRSSCSREKVDKYISVLKGSYDKALPYYEKVLGVFSLPNLMSMYAALFPRNIAKTYEKRLVYNEYMAASKPFDAALPFATYFLHYQPEMNTIPEAGLYCDQFQAIAKIASALPEGVRLVVKEHPSTFTKRCDRRWRPHGFYARIARIPNVQICPPGLNVFQFIDKAKFVASIAGVCLTEALVRGIPAVTFYSPRFTHFPADLVIDASSASVSELRVSLGQICATKPVLSEQRVLACMVQVALNGYDGSDEQSFIPRAIMQAATNSKRANCLAIQDVINGTLA